MSRLPTRRAARVLLLDAAGSVLLVQYSDEARTRFYWALPGGALEPGESARDAAIREVREETGLHVTLGALVHSDEFEMAVTSGRVLQCEDVFLARVDADAPDVRNSSSEDITALRWWTPEELNGANETVYPNVLAQLVGELTARPT